AEARSVFRPAAFRRRRAPCSSFHGAISSGEVPCVGNRKPCQADQISARREPLSAVKPARLTRRLELSDGQAACRGRLGLGRRAALSACRIRTGKPTNSIDYFFDPSLDLNYTAKIARIL